MFVLSLPRIFVKLSISKVMVLGGSLLREVVVSYMGLMPLYNKLKRFTDLVQHVKAQFEFLPVNNNNQKNE